MSSIFHFIFNCFSSIFTLLDTSLPGTELTFLDFTLLAIIIPLVIKLVKGSVNESSSHYGVNTLFNSSHISNYKDVVSSNYRTIPVNQNGKTYYIHVKEDRK